MNLRVIVAFLLLGGISPVVSSADRVPTEPEPLTIELREAVTLQRRDVTIGDIGTITGGNETVRKLVARLDVADLPTSGQRLTVKQKQVDIRLRLADFPAIVYRITGAKETVVSVERKKLSEEWLVQTAREALEKRMPWPAADIAIRLAQPVTANLPTVADHEDVTLKAEPHSSNLTIGRTQMDVSIYIRGERKALIAVYFEVRLLQKVMLARRAITKGETFTDANTMMEQRTVDPSTRNALAPEKVQGHVAKRFLAAGEVVSANDVDTTQGSEATLIKARQQVKMMVRLGAINVAAVGEALQDGRMGQSIRVQNIESKKVITGRVTGPALVEVESGGLP